MSKMRELTGETARAAVLSSDLETATDGPFRRILALGGIINVTTVGRPTLTNIALPAGVAVTGHWTSVQYVTGGAGRALVLYKDASVDQ